MLLIAVACRDSFAPPAATIPQVGGSRFRATVVGWPDHPEDMSIEGGVAQCKVHPKNGWMWCELTDTLSRSAVGADHDRTVVLHVNVPPRHRAPTRSTRRTAGCSTTRPTSRR